MRYLHHRRRSRLTTACRLAAFFIASVISGMPVHAQLRDGDVRHDSGPISELSVPTGAGSQPVHEPGRSVRDGAADRLGGTSVRESVTGDLSSGPVSDVSLGAVTSGRPVSGGGTVSDAAAGAVTKDVDSPLGEVISEPVRELRPLQERLRALEPLPRDSEETDQSNTGGEGSVEEPAAEEPPAEAEQPADEAASEPVALPQPEAAVSQPDAAPPPAEPAEAPEGAGEPPAPADTEAQPQQ